MYNIQLETFIKVADVGSFSKAGEDLFISSTAVIKQINLLEERLGLKLFDRSNKELRLTNSGKVFYEDVKHYIKYSEEILKRAKNVEKKENILKIGTSPITSEKILIELWPIIQKYCKGIKLKLINYDNTVENARKILKNLGKEIDVIPAIYDEELLK